MPRPGRFRLRAATAFVALATLLAETPAKLRPVLAQGQAPSPAPASGQSAPQAKPRTPPAGGQRRTQSVIRTFTDLVQIDVQVTDRSGKPVKGLKPEQFTLLEDDKPQKISTFDYADIESIETAAAQDTKPVVLRLGAVAPPEEVRQTVRDRRMLVLFFDLTSLEPEELLRAADAAGRYLRGQMTPADLVAVVSFGNRLKVLANFTNDRNLLLRAVRSLRPGMEAQLAGMAQAAPAAGEEGVAEDTGDAFTPDETEFNIFNTDRKLAAIESLAELLRTIPGRKSVIQFTGGLSQTGEENRSQLRAATDAANRSNVSFYTVDARGLQATVPGGEARAGAASGTAMFSGAAVFRQVQTRQDSRETLATLASDTGGRAFFDIGDFREVFEKVQHDAGGYYLLGYYTTNTKRDGRWRSVKVRVDARGPGIPPGLRVRYREGYYAPKDDSLFTAEDRERQLEEAMRSETPRVELPIALETTHFRLSDKEIFVPIAAKLASSALEWAEKRGRREAEFEFAAEVAEEQSRRVVAALHDTIRVRLHADDAPPGHAAKAGAIVYQGGVVLGPGHYRLKFLAYENETGRIGTFEEELVLPPAQTEHLELSSVLLSSQLQAAQKAAEIEKKALAPDAKLRHSPLEVAGEHIVPSVTRVFTTEQQLYVFFQAYLPHALGDTSKLRAGLVFFRNGERASETQLVEPAQVDPKTRTAAFRISLPLAKLLPGRYTVQAVAVDSGGGEAAFARNYFALRQPIR